MLLCNRIYYMDDTIDNALLYELSIHVAGDLIYMLLCNRIYYMDVTLDFIYELLFNCNYYMDDTLFYELIVHVV